MGKRLLTVYRFRSLKASIQTLANAGPVNVHVRGGENLLTVHRFGSLEASILTLANACPVNVSVRGGESLLTVYRYRCESYDATFDSCPNLLHGQDTLTERDSWYSPLGI